jgi:phosphonate transport system substrate-binding protein
LQATAIDSTVLETEFKRRPALREQVRIVDVMGPSPVPPWVVQTHLPAELRQDLRRLLLDMHQHPAGQAALALGDLARFAAVTDSDYDAIRDMEQVAAHINLANDEL